jgi:hypothetical protein
MRGLPPFFPACVVDFRALVIIPHPSWFYFVVIAHKARDTIKKLDSGFRRNDDVFRSSPL